MNSCRRTRGARLLAGAVFSGLFVISAFAIDADAPAKKTPAQWAAAPVIERISDNVMKIGEVTLDKSTKTITFPGNINMDQGDLEYLLVAQGGKTHESLLVTKAQPSHIHIAMLLLGVKIPAQPGVSPPPEYMNPQYLAVAPKPKGANVLIYVGWKQGDKKIAVQAEDLIFDDATKKPMPRGPWVYNGSMMSQGVFLAQEDRSIATLVIDPSALINNERPDSNNNQVWSVLSEKTPKAGTPVEISIQLQPDVPESKLAPSPK